MMIKLFLSIAIILLASTTAAAQGSFNDGVKQGKKDAERQWRNSGSDCGNIFGFQKQVDRNVKKNYPQSSNWRTDSYNRGARSGADEVVTKYEKKCLEDNPDECTDLGNAAAQEIAYDYCQKAAPYGSRPNYKKTCRQVAYGICEGGVQKNVQSSCNKKLTTSELRNLQTKCRGQVNSMTGGREDAAVKVDRHLRNK